MLTPYQKWKKNPCDFNAIVEHARTLINIEYSLNWVKSEFSTIEMLPSLIATIVNHKDLTERVNCIACIADIPKTPKNIQAINYSLIFSYNYLSETSECIYCIYTLSQSRDPSLTEYFKFLFRSDPRFAIRREICLALGEIGSHDSFDFLQRVSKKDIYPSVREAALIGMSKLQNPRKTSAFLDVLTNRYTNIDVRFRAAKILQKIDPELFDRFYLRLDPFAEDSDFIRKIRLL